MNLGISKILPAKDIAQYFTLKADRLRQWVNRVKKGKDFKEKEGAPRKIDTADLCSAVKDVIANAKSKIRVENKNSLFLNAQALTEAKNSNTPIATTPSETLTSAPRTIRRYEKALPK